MQRQNILEKLKKVISTEEIIRVLEDLVRIPSYPGIPDQETKVAQYIHDYFGKEGISSELVKVIDNRNNVMARLKGNNHGRSLLLTGHLDTVPPYNMKDDPFKARLEEGKIFGRGAVDMKGAVACMMAAMAGIKRAGIELQGDLVFAGVIDEEYKSEGTRALIKSGIAVDAAIVGEPTELDICVGHRGLEWFEVYFKGKSVHGGRQENGINAVSNAVKFLHKVERELVPGLKGRVHHIVGASSMNTGYIKGGTQPSTVPGECMVQLDRRWIPGEKFTDVLKEYQDILDALHREDANFSGEIKVMDVSLMDDGFIHEAMEIDPGHPVVKAAAEGVLMTTGRTPAKLSFPGWTDAGLLSHYGKIPTIVLGPGNIESAHAESEFIPVADLLPAALIYALIACDYCALAGSP